MFDVVIIGAGVVGGMIARKLSAFELKVALLEKAGDVGLGASRANSGIVHAGFDAKPGTLKAKLNVKGAEMMEQIARELGVPYRRNGSLVVGFDEADRATLAELRSRGEQNGVKGLRLLTRDEVRALEPQIGEGVTCALHAPTGAIVCPYELTIAAVGNAMDNGAELMLDYPVDGIEKTPFGYLVKSGERTVRARAVINCAGAFADEIARMVGDDSFHITPRRGEYLLLDKECGKVVNATVFRAPGPMGKGVLVSPTVDGNLLLGPTAEDLESKDDTRTTDGGLATVRARAREQVAGIPMNKTITSFAGLRAVGSTGDFIIHSPLDGFYNVAGIESPGLTAAPAIAEYVFGLMQANGMRFTPKKDVICTRVAAHAFRDMSAEEKNAVIRRDSRYAKIVCRCEGVSEGEILAAIRQNPRPRDLDGVKRRTRAQMGRCQGGFCGPYIVELLSRELGCAFEEVTKCGGASVINYGRTKGGLKNEEKL